MHSVHAANKAKVLFGLLKEPDINIPLDDDDDERDVDGDGIIKPKVACYLLFCTVSSFCHVFLCCFTVSTSAAGHCHVSSV